MRHDYMHYIFLLKIIRAVVFILLPVVNFLIGDSKHLINVSYHQQHYNVDDCKDSRLFLVKENTTHSKHSRVQEDTYREIKRLIGRKL